MKILIISTSGKAGGAAIAAHRLHKALLSQKIDSHMIVQRAFPYDTRIIGPSTIPDKVFSKIRPVVDKIPLRRYPHKSQTRFSPSWFPTNRIVNKINKLSPDIVHLHWICSGMLRIQDIARIKAPIVWSMHDMWPFTGGCHYDEQCNAYTDQCGKCVVLNSKIENDLSRRIFGLKQKIYPKMSKMIIVGLSRWISDCAQKSHLFRHLPIVNLPNPIDTRTFQPIDNRVCRDLWNLPQNKRLILFGAENAVTDPRKGFNELRKALGAIKGKDFELVVFGSNKNTQVITSNFKTHYLPYLNDDISMVTLYNAVDLMVVPSLQENLSNTILESLSCGTPVVAFNVGGNQDMIDHQINGYLAESRNSHDLANGIEWVLNKCDYEMLSKNARLCVKTKFDSSIVAPKYKKLYYKLLNI